MDVSNLDEPVSPEDISKPRYLFRRYDSASGSSGSNNSSFSSNSVGSFQQTRRGHGDRTVHRRRTISSTLNGSKRFDEDSASVLTNGKNRDIGKATGSSSDDPNDGEACIFCSSMVHERQYYLWQSQYTKSSLCSRCSRDNEGMRYISYWGTPSYETGSWRKRYRAGRGFDIDLSPLLEVLEKIDRMDTSMYGRKHRTSEQTFKNRNKKDPNNNNGGAVLKETTDTKESYEMSARRRRRLENRKIIENAKEGDNKVNTHMHANSSQGHQAATDGNLENANVATTVSRTNKEISSLETLNEINNAPVSNKNEIVNGDENNNNNIDKECLVFETFPQLEQIEVIQPLNLIHVEDQIPNEIQEERKPTESDGINTGNLQRPDQFSTPENMLNYLKERRKSNYQDFIAGLEQVTPLKRRSTAEKDLTSYLKKVHSNKDKNNHSEPKNIRITNTSSVLTNEVGSVCPGNVNSDTDANKTVSQLLQNITCSEVNVDLTSENKKIMNIKEIKNNKIESRRRKESSNSDEDYKCIKENTKAQAGPEVMENTQRRRPRKFMRKPCFTMNSSSSDDDQAEEESFSKIKNRFENLCRIGNKKRRNSLKSKQKVSKGHFRSQYLKLSNQQSYCDSTDSSEENSKENTNKTEYGNPFKVYNYKDNSHCENNNDDEKGNDNDIEIANFNEDDLSDISHPPDSELTSTTRTSITETKDVQSTTNETTNEHTENTVSNEPSENDEHSDPNDNSAQEEPGNKPKFQHDKEKTCLNGNPHQTKSKASSQKLTPFNVNVSQSTSPSVSSTKEKENCYHNEYKMGNSEGTKCSDEVEKNNENDFFELKPVDRVTNNNRRFDAKKRENKYKNMTDFSEEENPNIARIKKKLGRKPKYEENESDNSEGNDIVMELNGSNDEEVELCWRTRGYTKDFYMSRSSVTGGEIIDRYNRALSKRRSRRSKQRDRTVTDPSEVDKIMTQSEPVSRQEMRIGRQTHSAPLTRVTTRVKLQQEYDENDCIENGNSNGVSATALKAALDRATICSKRMSQRLNTQLDRGDSCGSSS